MSPFPYELNNPNRIKFPKHNIDVADAIKWVYDNIKDYGRDNRNIALLGHSAGAHLVSLTGSNKFFLENVGLSLSNIKGVIAVNTEGYDIIDKLSPANRDSLYNNAFGLNKDLHNDASPMEHISLKMITLLS